MNSSKSYKKIVIETVIDSNLVKTWINFDEYKALVDWTKDRELKWFLRYGGKAD